MTDLERDVLRARDSGFTEEEIALYILTSEDKVRRIIEIEEATCQSSGKS